MKNYAEFVESKQADQQPILDNLVSKGPFGITLDNASRGLMTDAGEVGDCIKWYIEYQEPLDETNLKEELGDCLFRIQQICNAMSWTMDQVIEANMAKLGVRYREGFTNEEAAEANRDRQAERETMEVTRDSAGATAKLEQTGQGFAEPPEANEVENYPQPSEELVRLAIRCGWHINEENYLTLPQYDSNHCAATWTVISLSHYPNKLCKTVVYVPDWLGRRMQELGQLAFSDTCQHEDPDYSGYCIKCTCPRKYWHWTDDSQPLEQTGQGFAEPPEETRPKRTGWDVARDLASWLDGREQTRALRYVDEQERLNA